MDSQTRGDLGTFVERADRLARTRLVTEVIPGGFNLQTSIRFEAGKGLWAANREPPEDDVLAFLLLLCPFITQRDRVSLRRTLNRCRELLTRDSDRRRLQEARAAWEAEARGGLIALKINDRPLPPERIADLLINGYYFHDEPAKRAELAEEIPAFHLMARQAFLSFVIAIANMVWLTANVIRQALDEDAFD